MNSRLKNLAHFLLLSALMGCADDGPSTTQKALEAQLQRNSRQVYGAFNANTGLVEWGEKYKKMKGHPAGPQT